MGADRSHRAHEATPAPLETTQALLGRIRGGDDAARNRLIQRFLPGLRRWAHGRLPAHARSMADTDDLVQVALLRALTRIGDFEAVGAGAFLSYLHRILINCIRDEIRRVQRLPQHESIDDAIAPPAAPETPLGLEPDGVQAYARALESLTDAQREAVILRVEFGFTYPEIAEALGRSSPDGVRMQVQRAMVRLAEMLGAYRQGT